MGWSRWMCHFWDHSDSVSFRWISASLREERWLVLGTWWCSWTTPSSRLLYACLSNDLLMLRHASSSSFPDSKKARLIRLWSVPSYHQSQVYRALVSHVDKKQVPFSWEIAWSTKWWGSLTWCSGLRSPPIEEGWQAYSAPPWLDGSNGGDLQSEEEKEEWLDRSNWLRFPKGEKVWGDVESGHWQAGHSLCC